MKYKTLLKPFLILTLIIIFSVQINATKVMACTYSTICGKFGGTVVENVSEVEGTVDNGTIIGNVSEVEGTFGNGSITGNVSEVQGTFGNGSITGTVSEVEGTFGNGSITGTVGGSGGGSSSGGGGSSSNPGTVLGTSTVAQPIYPGQVLGATYVPGFPTTGLGLLAYADSALILMVLSLLLLGGYGIYRKYRTS
ncbi:MAG TPA: hypothetical protein VFQ59_02305 [Candidatus Paceibacterota bacterium]|nr:hypothetical protein [Candidatus Paceibacterota bacterium]